MISKAEVRNYLKLRHCELSNISFQLHKKFDNIMRPSVTSRQFVTGITTTTHSAGGAKTHRSMSVIDSPQIPDVRCPRTIFEPENMTLRNSIHGNRIQKWSGRRTPAEMEFGGLEG